MSIRHRIRNWWQVQTGRDDTPVDGDTPFWVLSFVFHLALLVILAIIFVAPREKTRVSMVVPDVADVSVDEIVPEFDFNFEQNEEIGSDDEAGLEQAMAMAPTIDDEIEVSENYDLDPHDFGEIPFEEYVPQPVAIEANRLPVRGNAGFATTGTEGAIDRITHEILLSLEERKTLVIWMFDQSASLTGQRSDIVSRFDTIYSELSEIQEQGGEQFEKHSDRPLLTQVYGFGQNHKAMMKQPTDDVEEIKKAVKDIQIDQSGVENVFSAILSVASKYKHLRKVQRKTGDRERNVMIIVVSDETGEDFNRLDAAVNVCKTSEMPVYVIGIPAPFGRQQTFVKYVDPDPNFDQSTQWLPVNQGPESLFPERVRLNYSRRYQEETPIDSGFGPFALTRLCYESGGTYFTVHPNRKTGERVSRSDIDDNTAYFNFFFDAQLMRKYRPDYVSTEHYVAQVQASKARMALVQASKESWMSQMSPPRLRFEKLNEATFVNQVNRAQQPAALVTNKVNKLYEILKLGENDRKHEVVPRWKAGYDLAMGRVLAVKIRAESYNKLLAMLKTKITFTNPKNNVWMLRPSDEIITGSATEKLADRARMYLNRVIEEHPGTPWAYLAKKELETPLSWKLTEQYQKPPEPRQPRPQVNNPNQPRPERPERPRPQPKPKRTPKL